MSYSDKKEKKTLDQIERIIERRKKESKALEKILKHLNEVKVKKQKH
jgi:hypothetical protein